MNHHSRELLLWVALVIIQLLACLIFYLWGRWDGVQFVCDEGAVAKRYEEVCR